MLDWALLRCFKLTGDPAARHAAVRHLEWALKNQLPNGWFENCAFSTRELPLTHTLSYTTQGLVECGKILGDERLVGAARLGAEPLLEYFKRNSRLPGVFDRDWKPVVNWECVTGNSQTAIVWQDLARAMNNSMWTEWGDRLIQHTLRCQRVGSRISEINGAIPGSWPISGSYWGYTFPNHAAKFFADSLL